MSPASAGRLPASSSTQAAGSVARRGFIGGVLWRASTRLRGTRNIPVYVGPPGGGFAAGSRPAASELELPRRLHLRQLFDLLQHLSRQFAVDLDQRDRVAA